MSNHPHKVPHGPNTMSGSLRKIMRSPAEALALANRRPHWALEYQVEYTRDLAATTANRSSGSRKMASNSPLPPRNAGFPSVPQKSLPKSVYDPRRHVGVHAERVSDVSSTEYPGHYPDEDHSWSLEKFKKVRSRGIIVGQGLPC